MERGIIEAFTNSAQGPYLQRRRECDGDEQYKTIVNCMNKRKRGLITNTKPRYTQNEEEIMKRAEEACNQYKSNLETTLETFAEHALWSDTKGKVQSIMKRYGMFTQVNARKMAPAMWKRVKKVLKPQGNLIDTLSDNGSRISEPGKLHKYIERHLESKFGHPKELVLIPAKYVRPPLLGREMAKRMEECPSSEDLKEMIRKRKNKATGRSGIGFKHYEGLPEEVMAHLHELLIGATRSDQAQLARVNNRTSLIGLLKRDSFLHLKNYRNIALSEVMSKLAAGYVMYPLRKIWGDIMPIQQGAALTGRGQLKSAINVVSRLLECKDGRVVEIDIEGAFDVVQWELLWCTLKQQGFPDWWVQAVKEAWSTTSYSWNTRWGSTDHIDVRVGGKQGSLEMPFLFQIQMEQIRYHIEFRMGEEGIIVYAYMFVDDTKMICEVEEVKETLRQAKTIFRQYGMELADGKTKVMAVHDPDLSILNLTVNGNANIDKVLREAQTLVHTMGKSSVPRVAMAAASEGVLLPKLQYKAAMSPVDPQALVKLQKVVSKGIKDRYALPYDAPTSFCLMREPYGMGAKLNESDLQIMAVHDFMKILARQEEREHIIPGWFLENPCPKVISVEQSQSPHPYVQYIGRTLGNLEGIIINHGGTCKEMGPIVVSRGGTGTRPKTIYTQMGEIPTIECDPIIAKALRDKGYHHLTSAIQGVGREVSKFTGLDELVDVPVKSKWDASCQNYLEEHKGFMIHQKQVEYDVSPPTGVTSTPTPVTIYPTFHKQLVAKRVIEGELVRFNTKYQKHQKKETNTVWAEHFILALKESGVECLYPGKTEKRPYIWSPLSQDGNRVEQQDELVWLVTCRTEYVTGLRHLITTKWGNLRAGPKLKSEWDLSPDHGVD
eukprot:gene4643-2332_t